MVIFKRSHISLNYCTALKIHLQLFTHILKLARTLNWKKCIQDLFSCFHFFQVEVTKYDELEEVYAELRLKQLLWDSIDSWDQMVSEAMVAKFDTLDPEELTSTTMKYAKSVYQLEKGLPPNGVVPLLKGRVENMRDKVSGTVRDKIRVDIVFLLFYITPSTLLVIL